MKKLLAIASFFVLGLIIFPGNINAQYYSPYIYTNNAYLNYAIASQKAKATGKTGRTGSRRKSSAATRKTTVKSTVEESNNENGFDIGNEDLGTLVKTELQNVREKYNSRGYFTKREFQLIGAIGDYYYKQEDFNKSQIVFEGLIETNPKSSDAHAALGAVYAKQEKYKNALEQFDTAIKLDSRQIYAFANRAMVYLEQGKVKEATVDLKKAIELDPLKKNIASNAARKTLAALNDESLPNTKSVEKSVERNINNSGMSDEEFIDYGNRGAKYYKQGDVDKAQAIFEEMSEMRPKNAETHAALGAVLVRKKEDTEALKHLDLAIKLDNRQAFAYANRGKVYLRQNRIKDATADLERAIELGKAGNNPEVVRFSKELLSKINKKK